MNADEEKLKLAQEQQKKCDEPQLVFHGLDEPLQGVADETKFQEKPIPKENLLTNTVLRKRLQIAEEKKSNITPIVLLALF